MLLRLGYPIDDVFNGWRTGQEDRAAVRRPAADVTDDGEVFRIVMELPGVTKDGLEIELKDEYLKVSGKRPAAPEAQKFLVNGRDAALPFERRFTLGKDVDREHVKAQLADGLLTVTLPRRAEVKPHRVEVEVG